MNDEASSAKAQATEESGKAWARLSLFYVRLPVLPDDAAAVRFRAEVLYGEGEVFGKPSTAEIRTENLGDGIHVVRITNTLEEVAARLTEPSFEYRLGGGAIGLFTFGLVRRPPVVGVAGSNGWIRRPLHGAKRIHQFVRTDKPALLERIAQADAKATDPRVPATHVFEALARVATCEMRADHIQWLGDVVLAERAQSAAWWNPVTTEDRKSSRAIDLHVKADTTAVVQVQARIVGLDGMCLCDRLLVWGSGDREPKRVELCEEVGTVFLRAWEDGHLVLEEQGAVLRGFNTRIDVVSHTYDLRDRLTRKLEKSLGATPTSSAARVSKAVHTASPSGSSIRVSSRMNDEPWADMSNTVHAVLPFLLPPAAPHTFFPPEPLARAQAVLHFAALLSGAEEAYLVDPWFDAVGAEALLPRIRGNVRLKVVTNLPSADHTDQKAALVSFLENASTIGLPRGLQVICAHRENSGGQVFHDRWLLLRDGKRWRGFVLTNSFSGFATQYPLFVVETPLATTALLLNETEGLLDKPFVQFDELWPREAPVRRPRRSREFPLWRALLSGLVAKNGRREAEWLQAAQSAGFVQISKDGLSWRMAAETREATLSWLLQPARFKPPTRRGGRRRKWYCRARLCSRRPFDVGHAVVVLGEISARGFDADSRAIAGRIDQRSALAIEQVLRKTFREDPDPTRLVPGSSPARLSLRQALRIQVPLREAAVAGVTLCTASFSDFTRSPAWGRQFAYSVLLYMDPPRAVRICEKLLDVDLLMPFISVHAPETMVWTESISHAFLSSRSPLLRAFGAQSLVHTAFPSRGGRAVSRPEDPDAAVVALRTRGVHEEEIAYYLAVWGAHGDQMDTSGGARIAATLVRHAMGVSSAVCESVVELVFEQELPGRRFLAQVVEALAAFQDATVAALLEQFVRRFGQRLRLGSDEHLHFNRHLDPEITQIMAGAARALASARGTAAADEVHAAADISKLEKELAPLTPFRSRPGAEFADVALGWAFLWELLASATVGPAGQACIPLPSQTRAKAYLNAPRVGVSEDVRAVIREVLDGGLEVGDRRS